MLPLNTTKHITYTHTVQSIITTIARRVTPPLAASKVSLQIEHVQKMEGTPSHAK